MARGGARFDAPRLRTLDDPIMLRAAGGGSFDSASIISHN